MYDVKNWILLTFGKEGEGIVTGKVTEGFMGCSVYLGDSYMAMFAWLKCIELYIYNLYTLYLSTSMRKNKKWGNSNHDDIIMWT